jgi:hypothetical protein
MHDVDAMIRMTRNCTTCGKPQSIEIKPSSLLAWRNGELIQRAFPYLNSSERELLLSGTCEKCWDDMFKED